MSDYMTLVGVDSVESAGYRMKAAAESISSAASSMDQSVAALRQWGDDFLLRLEGILEADRAAREGKP